MILQALALPSHLHTQHKISKKSLVKQVTNASSTQKLLQDTLSSIYLVGHITPNNSNIPPYLDEQNEYLELMIIQCTLKAPLPSSKQCKELHQLFHTQISYPVVLELIAEDGQQVQWSLADKTINQADQHSDKLVLQEIFITPWLRFDGADQLVHEFKQAMHFGQQPKQHLFAYYQSLQIQLINYLLAQSLNKASLSEIKTAYKSSNFDKQRKTLRQIQQLKHDIAVLENKRNKTQQFNEKVELNIEIQQLKQQLIQLNG